MPIPMAWEVVLSQSIKHKDKRVTGFYRCRCITQSLSKRMFQWGYFFFTAFVKTIKCHNKKVEKSMAIVWGEWRDLKANIVHFFLWKSQSFYYHFLFCINHIRLLEDTVCFHHLCLFSTASSSSVSSSVASWISKVAFFPVKHSHNRTPESFTASSCEIKLLVGVIKKIGTPRLSGELSLLYWTDMGYTRRLWTDSSQAI